VYVPCDVCRGRRYNRETLEIRYRDRNIHEVLDMTVEDAAAFVRQRALGRCKLRTLLEVGLGYVRLGQSATTLSGGEAQRIKLARELAKRTAVVTLYILDDLRPSAFSRVVAHGVLRVLQQLCDGRQYGRGESSTTLMSSRPRNWDH